MEDFNRSTEKSGEVGPLDRDFLIGLMNGAGVEVREHDWDGKSDDEVRVLITEFVKSEEAAQPSSSDTKRPNLRLVKGEEDEV